MSHNKNLGNRCDSFKRKTLFFDAVYFRKQDQSCIYFRTKVLSSFSLEVESRDWMSWRENGVSWRWKKVFEHEYPIKDRQRKVQEHKRGSFSLLLLFFFSHRNRQSDRRQDLSIPSTTSEGLPLKCVCLSLGWEGVYEELIRTEGPEEAVDYRTCTIIENKTQALSSCEGIWNTMSWRTREKSLHPDSCSYHI